MSSRIIRYLTLNVDERYLAIDTKERLEKVGNFIRHLDITKQRYGDWEIWCKDSDLIYPFRNVPQSFLDGVIESLENDGEMRNAIKIHISLFDKNMFKYLAPQYLETTK